MTELHISLENCYGIKQLEHDFDFSERKVYAIYAPNGTMKSSLAQVFSDLSQNQVSKDRMYPDRVARREILDQAGTAVEPASVFVIQPYDEAFESDTASTLLVNAKLRKEYESLFEKIEAAKKVLIEALTKQAKTKLDVEEELKTVFSQPNKSLLQVLRAIRAELAGTQGYAPHKDVEYDKVFDNKVIGVIQQEPIRSEIEEYIRRYDKLLSESEFFKKNVFNYYDGDEVGKSLGSHGFFKAGHRVTLSGEQDLEVLSENGLGDLIAQEKERISADVEIRKRFEAVDKAFKKNANLRAYEAYLCEHQEILPLLGDIPVAKMAVWRSYLNAHFDLLHSLIEKYEKAEKRRQEIERQAEKERSSWEEVIDSFNERFSVPFTLSVSNKATASLGADIPALHFSFDDGTERVATDRDALVQSLSQGEKKALYLLNVIFEVQARIKSHQRTLFVVDDVADSFDYKNKYAIVQYLRDIQDEPMFCLLLLTHNFDFFRTVQSRFVPYNHCLMAVKTGLGIDLIQAEGIKNVFANNWKDAFHTDPKKRIACIPFMRNLIEYIRGDGDADFAKLTSLLHWRQDTAGFTQSGLDAVFNTLFGTTVSWSQPTDSVPEAIFSAAALCLTEPEGINFENKIVLSIAIRLAAEKYMVFQIDDPAFISGIQSTQTDALIKRFVTEHPSKVEQIAVLNRVQLMTPENIHLNSFMYEPILDMSDDHLRKLYRDVTALD